jgi:hypothetical protein
MIQSSKAPRVLTLGALCLCAAFGQAQTPPIYSRDNCVKVKDGKGAEYAAYLRDVVLKLAQVRVDSGQQTGFVVGQAVLPIGRSARCDYHIFATYSGFPAELSTPEQTAADMKKAGIAMSREAMIAKRNELSYLVSTDIWRWHERIGKPAKGGYSRLNFYKVQPGKTNDWVRMESTGWKQVAEAAEKEFPGTGWRMGNLAMPGGTGLPYNAITIDIFPSWEAMGKGISARTIWNKVHPNTDQSAYSNRMAEFVDRPRIDVLRIVEVIDKK